MSDVVSRAWEKYLLQLQLHPLRTKAITGGVLAGLSDFSAQKISGVKTIQLRRLFLIMLYGLLYSAPLGHFFHKLMDRIFKGKKGNQTVATKVLVEQLTISPWKLEQHVLHDVLWFDRRRKIMVSGKEQGRKRLPFGAIDCMESKFHGIDLFWPIVNWVNYQYMPPQLRVLFHSTIASCWAVFLNLKARSSVSKKA